MDGPSVSNRTFPAPKKRNEPIIQRLLLIWIDDNDEGLTKI